MKWLILDMLIPAEKKSFILAGNYIPGSICSVLILFGVNSIMQSPDPPLVSCLNKVGFLSSARVMLSLGLKP